MNPDRPDVQEAHKPRVTGLMAMIVSLIGIVIAPLLMLGFILGIIALFTDRKNRGKAVIAIVIPTIVIALVVVLIVAWNVADNG